MARICWFASPAVVRGVVLYHVTMLGMVSILTGMSNCITCILILLVMYNVSVFF